MIVRVLLFAAARHAVGDDFVDIELPEKATIADLRTALIATAPGLTPVVESAMFSVNAEFADDATKIDPRAEIACIPPVSGG